ncbi:hypothetical protein [Armatimonas sp.]|uniref:hypothetical protein n=1 Tax=Armatimonas sp. TaxID=1872638 RepID=UPI00286BEC74|nr:hypothetical protein [Armatimonas sp.]
MEQWITLGCIISFSFLPAVIVYMWERRIVWPYSDSLNVDPSQDEHRNVLNQEYIDTTLEEMRQCGFRLLCRYYDARRPQYKLSYIFAISEDRQTMALLGYGDMLGIHAKGVNLISKNSDNHYYYTTNTTANESYDVSETSDTQVFLTAKNFIVLYNQHKKWLLHRTIPSDFSSDGALQEYRNFFYSRCELRQSRGLIRYIDSEKREWRYTLWGAMKMSVMSVLKMLFRF